MQTPATPEFTTREFRDVLGNFATGIAVVTSRDSEGRPVGCTINSFASVSLDPPLVSFCIDRQAGTFAAFLSHGHFALHFLAEHQEEVSRRFAKAGEDKFGAVEPVAGIGNVPLLSDCLAHLECSVFQRIDAGDHVLILGRVEAFSSRKDLPPLLYFRGRYARVASE